MRSGLIRTTAAVAGLVCAMLLGACGGSGHHTSTNSAQGGQSKSTLVIAWPNEPMGLDKSLDSGDAGIRVMEQIYARLVEPSPDGSSVVPVLAQGWRVEAGGRRYVFTLRPGLRFSNGRPLTSRDVLFSLAEAQAPTDQLSALFAQMKVQASGPRTVTITTPAPFPALLKVLTLWPAGVVPANYGGLSRKAFYNQPVSSGGYELARWDHGQDLVLTRNPDFVLPNGGPKTVTFKLVPDANTRISLLRAGQVDLIQSVPNDAVAGLRQDSSLTVQVSKFANIDDLLVNLSVPGLSDARVRQAMSLAIDRAGLVKSVLAGIGAPGATFVSNLIVPKPLPPLPYNPSQAKALLQQAHLSGGHFSLLYDGSNPDVASEVQAIQAEFQQIGINVTPTNTPISALLQQVLSGKSQLAVYPDFSSDITDPYELVGAFVANHGFVGYKNPKVAQLFAQAAVTVDPSAQAALYDQLFRQVNADMPAIPLTERYNVYVWRTGVVQGFTPDVTGHYDLTRVRVH